MESDLWIFVESFGCSFEDTLRIFLWGSFSKLVFNHCSSLHVPLCSVVCIWHQLSTCAAHQPPGAMSLNVLKCATLRPSWGQAAWKVWPLFLSLWAAAPDKSDGHGWWGPIKIAVGLLEGVASHSCLLLQPWKTGKTGQKVKAVKAVKASIPKLSSWKMLGDVGGG